ncbi:Putative GTP cyclohydrolase URC1 [Durusdinium trenchii]|uniref:GTP cyclohydrolase URC1 n=1 Tax=Durusdinium trenchii TaxID=1381693 RepID=A0ABP0RM23_9DINO
MEPGMGCVTTLAVLWAPVHLYLTQTDWRALRNWLGRIGVAADRNVLKEKRVEEEMLSLRQRNYKLFSSFISHLNFFSMYGFSYDALAAPELDNIFVAACCILSYVQHLMVAQEWLSMSPQRLKLVAVLHHSAGLLLRIMTGISASPMKFAVMHGFNIAVRFMLVFTFLDPWVSIPFQVLYTLADVFEYVLLFEGTSEQAGSLWYSQFFICLLSIAASILIDSVLRARIYALLDTADAESLVSSFRRVLRGVCDGEVLLDSHMNVAKESECLKHLILTNVSLTGSSFLDLLDGEQHRFKAFIDSSMASPEPKDSLKRTDTPPANGLRVSLRGSEGVRVAADLYHVPVPGLFGAKEPFHLIAFKEDLDSRTHPEAAEGAVPDALQLSGGGCAANASRDPIGQQTDTASIRSASTSRSSSAPAAFLDLQEMFLLVDVDTELQDVQQVELNFKRQEEPLDVPSGLHSGMPSLRKLVKPMDWEKVRSKVSKFVEKSMRGDVEVQGKSMNPMTVQLPGHSGWLVVEEASLHPSQDAKAASRKAAEIHESWEHQRLKPSWVSSKLTSQLTGFSDALSLDQLVASASMVLQRVEGSFRAGGQQEESKSFTVPDAVQLIAGGTVIGAVAEDMLRKIKNSAGGRAGISRSYVETCERFGKLADKVREVYEQMEEIAKYEVEKANLNVKLKSSEIDASGIAKALGREDDQELIAKIKEAEDLHDDDDEVDAKEQLVQEIKLMLTRNDLAILLKEVLGALERFRWQDMATELRRWINLAENGDNMIRRVLDESVELQREAIGVLTLSKFLVEETLSSHTLLAARGLADFHTAIDREMRKIMEQQGLDDNITVRMLADAKNQMLVEGYATQKSSVWDEDEKANSTRVSRNNSMQPNVAELSPLQQSIILERDQQKRSHKKIMSDLYAIVQEHKRKVELNRSLYEHMIHSSMHQEVPKPSVGGRSPRPSEPASQSYLQVAMEHKPDVPQTALTVPGEEDDPEATPRASGIETETGEAAAPSSASLPLARRERRKSITAGRERVDCRGWVEANDGWGSKKVDEGGLGHLLQHALCRSCKRSERAEYAQALCTLTAADDCTQENKQGGLEITHPTTPDQKALSEPPMSLR